MLLRKINAGLALLTTILLLDHAIFLSVWMLSRGSITKSETVMPWILMVLMVIHALISIDLGISAHSNIEKVECKKYSKLNLGTMVQRMSGIFMIILLVLHIIGASNHYQPKILHAVFHPIFFGLVLAHVAVSTSKSLIALGIGNAKIVKVVDVVVKVICGVTLVGGAVGFYLFLFMGAAQ